MKGREFIRRLKKNGVEIIESRGKGGHVLAVHGDKRAPVPVHGDTDLGPVFLKKVCRQLGLDPEEVLR